MTIKAKEIFSVPDGVYSVANGLILRVRNGGKSRSWIFRYSKNGKRRDYAIGSAKKVTMPAAKVEAAKLIALVSQGVDIHETKKKAKEEATPLHPFETFAVEALAHLGRIRQWKGIHSKDRYSNALYNHCMPVLKGKNIEEITSEDILNVLRPIWFKTPRTGAEARIFLDFVFSYAISLKIYDKLNPARWKDNLSMFLPSSIAVKPVKHYEAMPYEELREKIKPLSPPIDRRMALLIFTILTVSRINESREAKWSEIDFEKRVWICPRVKNKRRESPHRVPLSDQAIQLLNGLTRGKSDVIFTDKFDSEAGMPFKYHGILNGMRKAFDTDATIHGFRSSFRDWCAENGKSFEAAEISMQHEIGSEVTRSYFRSDLLEQRRVLMQEWADYLLGDSANIE